MSTKSFTTRSTQVDFDIDGEVFWLRNGIAAGQMFDISSLQGKMVAEAGNPDGNTGKMLMKELEEIFDPESFQRFEPRFWGKDAEGRRVSNPIDLGTFNEIFGWLFGEALGKGISPQ